MWVLYGVVLLCVLGLVAWRHRVVTRDRPRNFKRKTVSTLVIMGSGGHTAEMLRMLRKWDTSVYTPRVYVRADTDTHSEAKVRAFEADVHCGDDQYQVLSLPRSREVGQSYITSVFTTLHAMVGAFRIVYRAAPDLVLSNGPGTAVPLCFAAYACSMVGLMRCSVVYVESICRVKHLSLSARLLEPFVTKLIVQWPLLQGRGREYTGLISQ